MMADTLFLTWQDPLTRRWFPVGKLLSGDGQFTFEYVEGALEAQEFGGFEAIWDFPDLNARYQSDELFPLFLNRVLPRSRPEYDSVLNWLKISPNGGANEDDRVAILSRSGGRRATDTFEVFPCPKIDGSGEYKLFFLLHGLSHMSPESVLRAEKLECGEPLLLLKDLQNPVDTAAFMLRTAERYEGDLHILGYVPAYLNAELDALLGEGNGASPMMVVERVNHDPAPLQFRVLCRMIVRPREGYIPFQRRSYMSLAKAEHESKVLEVVAP